MLDVFSTKISQAIPLVLLVNFETLNAEKRLLPTGGLQTDELNRMIVKLTGLEILKYISGLLSVAPRKHSTIISAKITLPHLMHFRRH